MRQLLDDKVLCTLEKPFEWKTIEDLSVISSINISDLPNKRSHQVSPRLLVSRVTYH